MLFSWAPKSLQMVTVAMKLKDTYSLGKKLSKIQSVQSLSLVLLFESHGLQHARLPCSSPTPGVYSNLCSLSQWCHTTISSSVVPFSSCVNLSQHQALSNELALFIRGPSIGPSASASVLLRNIQGWFPLGLTGLISLQSKGLSRVFSNISIQKHQFFGAQPSLWSNSHIHTWPLEKP